MLKMKTAENSKSKSNLSTIIVVAEVPSMEMDLMAGRRLTGISSKRLKSVVFQDLTQSTVASLFLENTNKLATHLPKL